MYCYHYIPKFNRNWIESGLGVISLVDQSTVWYAGIVIVPKKNEAIRICINLKPLNANVQGEVYPLPTVVKTLAQLYSAHMFSKLNANSSFWQILLTISLKLLTTFLSHNGRRCFNKMLFGISCSAPEHYQKRMASQESYIIWMMLLYSARIPAAPQ